MVKTYALMTQTFFVTNLIELFKTTLIFFLKYIRTIINYYYYVDIILYIS